MINKDPDKQTNVLPVQYKVYPQRWWILGKVSSQRKKDLERETGISY